MRNNKLSLKKSLAEKQGFLDHPVLTGRDAHLHLQGAQARILKSVNEVIGESRSVVLIVKPHKLIRLMPSTNLF